MRLKTISKLHSKAAGAASVKDKQNSDPATAHPSTSSSNHDEAAKVLLSLKEDLRGDLELKFKNLYAVLKKGRPISEYIWFNNLDKNKRPQK